MYHCVKVHVIISIIVYNYYKCEKEETVKGQGEKDVCTKRDIVTICIT